MPSAAQRKNQTGAEARSRIATDNAVIAGEVQAIFIPSTVALPLVKASRVKAVAFTGVARLPTLPQVPTMSEAGVANIELTGSWHAWFAPARTPASIMVKLAREAVRAVQAPRAKEAIINGGYEPDGRSGEALRKFLQQEEARYTEMVRVAQVPKTAY